MAPPFARSEEEQLLLYARDLRHLIEIERGQRALLESAYSQTVTALTSALEWKDTVNVPLEQTVKLLRGVLTTPYTGEKGPR